MKTSIAALLLLCSAGQALAATCQQSESVDAMTDDKTVHSRCIDKVGGELMAFGISKRSNGSYVIAVNVLRGVIDNEKITYRIDERPPVTVDALRGKGYDVLYVFDDRKARSIINDLLGAQRLLVRVSMHSGGSRTLELNAEDIASIVAGYVAK